MKGFIIFLSTIVVLMASNLEDNHYYDIDAYCEIKTYEMNDKKPEYSVYGYSFIKNVCMHLMDNRNYSEKNVRKLVGQEDYNIDTTLKYDKHSLDYKKSHYTKNGYILRAKNKKYTKNITISDIMKRIEVLKYRELKKSKFEKNIDKRNIKNY